MQIHRLRRRSEPLRQLSFRFLERQLEHERWFKWFIAAATAVVIALVLRMMPWGRFLVESTPSSARQAMRGFLGLGQSRAEIEDGWRRFRQLGIDTTRPTAERVYAQAGAGYQRLMQYAGLDPEHMLLRWGNYDWTLLLSSRVFEADDDGRAYRFRPRTRSIWLRNVEIISSVPTFYLVPDEPGLAQVIKGIRADPVESSRQTTNSWGLRGPEPVLEASIRGIVLGDSYMQGMFIGDDETPPACLERSLRATIKTTVSVLNTGVMGYSPEQYYYTLIAFASRFRPQFVVVSVFLNDFGDIDKVRTTGVGDWLEGKYWLERIIDYCREQQYLCLVVPVPFSKQLEGRRLSGHYQGQLSNALSIDSLQYLDPIEDFANAELKFKNEAKRKNQPFRHSPLYNGALGDGHFSAAGAELWAAAVGRRLVLLLDREPATDPQAGPAKKTTR